jgi:hypothetical protein
MNDTFVLSRFSPISLTLEKIGPFQDRLEHFSFLDSFREPCNYFLLLSQNGRGKTHILESMAALMGVLGQKIDSPPAPFSFEPLAKGEGRAQLDFLVTYSLNGIGRTEVVSIFGGFASEETWLKYWSDDLLSEMQATAWHRIGVIRRTDDYRWSGIQDDEWSRDFVHWVSDTVGENVGHFAGSSLTAPTLIYFPAYRDVVAMPEISRAIEPPNDWDYRPLHIFRQEGAQWRESLDNLLVWLMWLNDDRYDAALELINDYVFNGTDKLLIGIPNRNELTAKIQRHNDKRQTHRLDQLSSGEKSLIQIFLRLGAHMTKNTILIIDEVDAHLHPQWRTKIAMRLKEMLVKFDGLSIFLASHADEIIDSLSLDVAEPGLVKGGELLLTREEEIERGNRKVEAQFVINSYSN